MSPASPFKLNSERTEGGVISHESEVDGDSIIEATGSKLNVSAHFHGLG